jgi:hypothetical protein
MCITIQYIVNCNFIIWKKEFKNKRINSMNIFCEWIQIGYNKAAAEYLRRK